MNNLIDMYCSNFYSVGVGLKIIVGCSIDNFVTNIYLANRKHYILFNAIDFSQFFIQLPTALAYRQNNQKKIKCGKYNLKIREVASEIQILLLDTFRGNRIKLDESQILYLVKLRNNLTHIINNLVTQEATLSLLYRKYVEKKLLNEDFKIDEVILNQPSLDFCIDLKKFIFDIETIGYAKLKRDIDIEALLSINFYNASSICGGG